MSRIVSLSVYTHANDLGDRVWNPLIRWSIKYAVFVRIEVDDGYVGIGECWCFDTAPDALVAFVRTEIAPHIVDMELNEFETVADNLNRRATLSARHGILASALSGVDIAVWDIRARQYKTNLATLLNGDNGSLADNTVSLYASGGLYAQGKGVKELASEMASMAGNGFSMLKMKIGGASIEEDLARIEGVIAAIPDNAMLIVDGVYSYTATEALRIFECLPLHRIEAFQSPVAAENIEAMCWLTREGVPVMANEAEYRVELHQRLVETGAVRFLQTAPIASGGISGLQSLVELVKDSDVRLSLEVSSTAIALMAACQFAAGNKLVAHVEYHYLHQVFFDYLPLEVSQENSGSFRLPTASGLGIELPEEDVQLAFQVCAKL